VSIGGKIVNLNYPHRCFTSLLLDFGFIAFGSLYRHKKMKISESCKNAIFCSLVNYLSCFPCGLLLQEPTEDEPQHTHFVPPFPCWCFLCGLYEQEPYELEPQKTQCFSSPECSCLPWGLCEQDPYDEELQKMHLSIVSLLG
jgi:hypothetical protein